MIVTVRCRPHVHPARQIQSVLHVPVEVGVALRKDQGIWGQQSRSRARLHAVYPGTTDTLCGSPIARFQRLPGGWPEVTCGHCRAHRP